MEEQKIWRKRIFLPGSEAECSIMMKPDEEANSTNSQLHFGAS